MVREIKAKAVLRLDGQGLSGRAIARSPGIARQSVSETPGAAKTAGVGWDDVADRPDDEVYALLFPGRGERESVYARPDWARVHRESARVGVTLGIPHGEYVDGCRRAGKPYMGCDRFRKPYAAHVPELGVTGGVGHKAGRTIEVDWASRTMRIVDPVTGDSSTVCLFVGVLPSGRYAFAEPALDMTRNTWLRAHVAMCEWFGGSTPRLVCDDLRTGVIRHPREGGIVLNDAYRGMAGHYSAAVLPGRVKRPKDKPLAENTVWHATMALVGASATAGSVRRTSCVRRYANGSRNTTCALSGSATAPGFPCSNRGRGRCRSRCRQCRTRWRTGRTAGGCGPTAM